MLSNEETKEIKSMVKDAFDDMLEIGTDTLGIYNYVRNCNEDFGEEMYINDDIAPCDNTEVQHCYLTLVLFEACKRKCIISKELINLYLENKTRYILPDLRSEEDFITKNL